MNGTAGQDAAASPEDEASATDSATAAGQAPAAAAGEDVGETLAELSARADENWDRYLRAAAELENVRKRATRDVEHARRYALERFAGELLNVRDSLEMGLAAGSDSSAETLMAGSTATLKLLHSTMEQFGVVELDPQGEPFDPEFHEAMTMQPSADVEPGSVLTVYQKGYTLNGRLLRPARVVVAQALPDDGASA
jgi:molecular chaperone GrpE